MKINLCSGLKFRDVTYDLFHLAAEAGIGKPPKIDLIPVYERHHLHLILNLFNDNLSLFVWVNKKDAVTFGFGLYHGIMWMDIGGNMKPTLYSIREDAN